MRRSLLSSCSSLALAAALLLGSAGHLLADDADGKTDRLPASSYISVEGGVFFDQSDENFAFDPGDDKLGDLAALSPGDAGWQARIDYGRQIDSTWDYKVGLGLTTLGEDTSFDDEPASAAQDLKIGIADLEVGFRPELSSQLDVRIFGGVRGLGASSNSSWEAPEDDKLGEFDDETFAIGPRIGVDLFMPVESERGIGLVGSLSGAALFGSRSTDYDYADTGQETPIVINDSFSDSVTIWNVDAMAGVSVPLTEGATVTLGYKAQSFQNLVAERSNIQNDGSYDEDGDGDVLIHGPFVKLTVPLS